MTILVTFSLLQCLVLEKFLHKSNFWENFPHKYFLRLRPWRLLRNIATVSTKFCLIGREVRALNSTKQIKLYERE